MHINNVSQKTSLSMPIMCGIFSIIYTVGLLLAYFMNISETASIQSFWNWVKDAYNTSHQLNLTVFGCLGFYL